MTERNDESMMVGEKMGSGNLWNEYVRFNGKIHIRDTISAKRWQEIPRQEDYSWRKLQHGSV